jgi:hypothetical protein
MSIASTVSCQDAVGVRWLFAVGNQRNSAGSDMGSYFAGCAWLAALAVLDPSATVPLDVEKVIAAPQVSPKIKVSGHSYDVKTGLVTTVVPPWSRQGR